MPYFRYVVSDEMVTRSGTAIDWGTQVDYEPRFNTRVYEIWVNDEREARQFVQYANVTGSVSVNEWQETLWYQWVPTTTSTAPTYSWVEARERREDQLRLERRASRERALEERRHAYQREHRERLGFQNAAHARALELFRVVLTDEEYKSFEERSAVVITGSDGQKYKVVCDGGYEGNVYLLDHPDRNELVQYCCHPKMWSRGLEERIPVVDAWVAQILAIKTNVEHFLTEANIQSDWRGIRRTREVQTLAV